MAKILWKPIRVKIEIEGFPAEWVETEGFVILPEEGDGPREVENTTEALARMIVEKLPKEPNKKPTQH